MPCFSAGPPTALERSGPGVSSGFLPGITTDFRLVVIAPGMSMEKSFSNFLYLLLKKP